MSAKNQQKSELKQQEAQILKIMVFLGLLGLAFSVLLVLLLD